MMRLVLTLLCVFLPLGAAADPGIEAFSVQTTEDGSQTYTLTLQIMLMMTALTLLPGLVLAMTSFTRIIVVLAILRQALGTAQTPSSQILIGLALIMTMFIMAPVIETVYQQAVQPYLDEQISVSEALARAEVPVREFMLRQTRESDLALFTELADRSDIQDIDAIPFNIIMPSFVTSELKTAFQIGFLIFIPFLVIDLVVASVLMSMGMMMLSPLIISLPFKIMLFILIDGWALIVGTLTASFYA